jgi:hypothetical protein
MEWISVKDGLPQFEVPVLACRRNGSTDEYNYEACVLQESDFDDCEPYWLYHADGELAENVLFWTPLNPPEASHD